MLNEFNINIDLSYIDTKFICIFNNEKLDFKYNLTKNMQLCEYAHWYYLDELVNKHNLQKINFYTFLTTIFLNKKMNAEINKISLYNSIYNRYKKKIPTAGCIILCNNNICLVKIRHSNKFGLPKGKKNGFETIYETAIREVKEETGIDIEPYIIDKKNYIEVLKTKLYIVNYPTLNNEFNNYDVREIEEVKWFDFNYIMNNKKLFTNQVKITLNDYLLNQ
jgi:8-oxo-dGTP pyrophosphatase MutT (NUDIX family)